MASSKELSEGLSITNERIERIGQVLLWRVSQNVLAGLGERPRETSPLFPECTTWRCVPDTLARLGIPDPAHLDCCRCRCRCCCCWLLTAWLLLPTTTYTAGRCPVPGSVNRACAQDNRGREHASASGLAVSLAPKPTAFSFLVTLASLCCTYHGPSIYSLSTVSFVDAL